MRTVYYYDEEGRFSQGEVEDYVTTLALIPSEPMIAGIGEGVCIKYPVVPISKYVTRYGETIWLANRNEFEAKCLIKNHLDLDIHIENSYPDYVWEEHNQNIKDDLTNRLIHKTKHKYNPSFIIWKEYGIVTIRASL